MHMPALSKMWAMSLILPIAMLLSDCAVIGQLHTTNLCLGHL